MQNAQHERWLPFVGVVFAPQNLFNNEAAREKDGNGVRERMPPENIITGMLKKSGQCRSRYFK